MKPKNKEKKTVLPGIDLGNEDLYVALPGGGFRRVRPPKATKRGTGFRSLPPDEEPVIVDGTAEAVAKNEATIFMGGGYPPKKK